METSASNSYDNIVEEDINDSVDILIQKLQAAKIRARSPYTTMTPGASRRPRMWTYTHLRNIGR